MEIPRRQLGNTGVAVTQLGLGGEGILRTYGQEREAARVIAAALEAGIRYFESARVYSGSEAYLGQGLKGRRQEVFLTSKSHGRTAREAQEHLETTLKNLQTDYLDLWQVHDVRTMVEVEAIGVPGGALEAFYKAKEEGKVRFVGVTGHHDPVVLRAAIQRYQFDTVLLPVNPAEPRDRSFLPLAAEAAGMGLGVVGMKVLCRGLLMQLPDMVLEELVAYALSHPVSVIVVGADSVPQVKALAAAAARGGSLDDDGQQLLEGIVGPYAHGLMYYKP